VTYLFIILLAAALDAQPDPASTNGAHVTSVKPIALSDTNPITELEYQKLQADDDAVQAEVDKLVRQNTAAKATGGGLPEAELQRRIAERVAPVGKAYQEFIRRHPNHARAHLAYGCFLNDRQNEAGAQAQWEKALELDPANADVYNNLAGRYSEIGPLKKAFDYYAKAIELKPSEALYYYNFANVMYVFRRKAMVQYGLDEQQILARAIQLYSNSVRLDPTNFGYASDLAQTYYSIKPFPARVALNAWSNTLQTAHDPFEREEAYVHLARATMLAGQLAEARELLRVVTNSAHAVLKSNLLHSIEQREIPQPDTNGLPPPRAKGP